ncbi:hypothetical protein EV368DRAFT_69379 [Lentinula lateritia]|nr:hypothetical protein EV368DRAFT_69379 [Lentinula lateritia]
MIVYLALMSLAHRGHGRSFVAKAMLESRRRGSVDYRDAQACRLRLGQFCTKLLSIAAASSHLNDELALFKENITVEAPALHFTLPGHGIELKLVLKAILGSGSTLQAKAFRERFRKIHPDWRSTSFHCGRVGDVVWEWG